MTDPAALHTKAQGPLQPDEITFKLSPRARNVAQRKYAELELQGHGLGSWEKRWHGSNM